MVVGVACRIHLYPSRDHLSIVISGSLFKLRGQFQCVRDSVPFAGIFPTLTVEETEVSCPTRTLSRTRGLMSFKIFFVGRPTAVKPKQGESQRSFHAGDSEMGMIPSSGMDPEDGGTGGGGHSWLFHDR